MASLATLLAESLDAHGVTHTLGGDTITLNEAPLTFHTSVGVSGRYFFVALPSVRGSS